MREILFALNGVVNKDNDTKQDEFTTEMVENGFQYARNLKNNGFPVFMDANLTLIKMLGLNEYDKYRSEIMGEILTELTEFGTSVENETTVLGKVVQQMGLQLGNDLSNKNKLAKENKSDLKNAKNLNLRRK